MGCQGVWFAVIIACQLSAVYTLTIVNTNSTEDNTNSTANPAEKFFFKLFGVTPMRYDDYYDRYNRHVITTSYSPLFWILIALGVFVVVAVIVGAILLCMRQPKPKQGFVINNNGQPNVSPMVHQVQNPTYTAVQQGYVVSSNGQQNQNVPVQQVQNPSYPGRKQGYVVSSNGQQNQNVPVQQVQNPSYPGQKQGYVVSSNGQQNQKVPVQQVQNPSYPGQKQGYVVSSNATVQQNQKAPTQEAENPGYQPEPMYPSVQTEQKY